MRDCFISRSSRLSSIVRLNRVTTSAHRVFSRRYYQGQYTQPHSYFPRSFPQPVYFNNDIPWSQHSRWVRWPSYLCAAGIVGWWGWAFWHIEKSPSSDRRRIMFYSQQHMADMQYQSEHGSASSLGTWPLDMMEYFATAKHVLNDAESEMLEPVVQKLKVWETIRERVGRELVLSIHLVDENSQWTLDHSMWPGRLYITLFNQNHVAVDEVGLATIVSHSLGHAVLNHRGEVLSFAHFENYARYPAPVLALLAIASKQMRIPAAIYCLCVGALYICGHDLYYSNTLEKEADIWGLELMRNAGYDVTKATQYWERKMRYSIQVIDRAKIQRGAKGVEANVKKRLDRFMKFHREDVEVNKKHIATIQKYIKDNDILPLPFEEPKRTEDPPKPTEPEENLDSDVPEPEQ